MKKRTKIGIGAVGAALVIGVLSSGGDDATEPTAAKETSTTQSTEKAAPVETEEKAEAAEEKTEAEAVETEKETKKAEKKEPKASVAQQQALSAAQNYVDSMPFSKQALIDQLTSEYGNGFDLADAEYAVKHVNVDWNAEAVEAAESYLDLGMGFSRQGLIDQLTSEYGSQFTVEQANYAADQVGL